MRFFVALFLLWPALTAADSASVRVTASIASSATIVVEDNCAHVEANTPEVIALITHGGVQYDLSPDDP
jgi:hypothetical protein